MSKNRFELDAERLATTDELGNRVYLYPEDIKGIWKSRRTIFYWFLIILYLVLPWFYINGKPSLFIDIQHREFTLMGFTLHGMEPILFFLLLASGLFLMAFLTSVYGRVWCGWACPQTVFIQTIFAKVETLIEGKARARRALDEMPWNAKKIMKKLLKWMAFLFLSLHIAHTFIGYFVGPKELFLITLHSPFENIGLFTATMIVTAIILFDFGWFREQFCIIACPYGRIQSVMMDENSLVVGYDAKRGEPRRGTQGIDRNKEGDCINCYQCVKVCPTGIDIRRGTQMECIACTLCIDACDSIMEKLDKPKGLIRYTSEKELTEQKKSPFSYRSLIYVVLSTIFIGTFIYFANKTADLQVVFIRAKTPFTEVKDENAIMNQFQLKMNYHGKMGYLVKISLPTEPKIQIIIPRNPLLVDNNEQRVPIFFRFDSSLLVSGTRKIQVHFTDEKTQKLLTTKEVTLVGPNYPVVE